MERKGIGRNTHDQSGGCRNAGRRFLKGEEWGTLSTLTGGALRTEALTISKILEIPKVPKAAPLGWKEKGFSSNGHS